MLTKATFIFQRFPLAYFCSANNNFGKKLTQNIIGARNDEELAKLINKYHGSFNLYNITALLKRISSKIQKNQGLIDLAYKEIQLAADELKKPQVKNSRAIANIIGYTGNLGYHGFDSYIKQIKLKELPNFTNEKQFVMAFTGLLKLDLLQYLVKDENLLQFLKDYVDDRFNFGLLVSLWRNLIKHNKSTPQINIFFAHKITNVNLSQHMKDFGYLVYCYTESYNTFDSAKLLTTIQKCSQNIPYTTRINMFELCIMVDHLAKLSEITKMTPDADFISLLQNHYMRIIKSQNLDLRSLANGFLSFYNFVDNVEDEVHSLTTSKFLQFLNKNIESIEDYESVVSLFLQLISTSVNKNKAESLVEEEKLKRIKTLLSPIFTIFFSEKSKKILQMPHKQFQKLLYSFSVYKKFTPGFELTQDQKQMICQSILLRQNLTQKQIISISAILGQFQFKNKSVCCQLYQLGMKQLEYKQDELLRKTMSKPCLMGYKSHICLKCLRI